MQRFGALWLPSSFGGQFKSVWLIKENLMFGTILHVLSEARLLEDLV